MRGRQPDAQLLTDLVDRFQGSTDLVASIRIDPLRMTPGELRNFNIPPQPNPERQPKLHGAWLRAYGRALRSVPFSVDVEALRAVAFQPTVRPQLSLDGGGSRFGTSRNWSGAMIDAVNSQRFDQIYGFWRVPDFAPAPDINGLPYQVSVWIGLDGSRRYFDASLPQAGTTTTYDPVTDQFTVTVWVQWFLRDGDPSQISPVPLPRLTVKAGNEVACSLWVVDPTHVAVSIVNLSTFPDHSGLLVTSPHTLPPGLVRQPIVTGATGEWVLERPGIFGTDLLSNFPNYETARIEGCVAGSADGTERDLTVARYLRLYDGLHQPERTQFVSMPTRAGTSSVDLHYGDTAFG